MAKAAPEIDYCYPFMEFSPLGLNWMDKKWEELDISKISELPDRMYMLWATRHIQQNGIDAFFESTNKSDLKRLRAMLEISHRRSHNALDELSAHPLTIVNGSYLTGLVFHEGVVRMLKQVDKRLTGKL